jgi:hypothetical protein
MCSFTSCFQHVPSHLTAVSGSLGLSSPNAPSQNLPPRSRTHCHLLSPFLLSWCIREWCLLWVFLFLFSIDLLGYLPSSISYILPLHPHNLPSHLLSPTILFLVNFSSEFINFEHYESYAALLTALRTCIQLGIITAYNTKFSVIEWYI